MKARVTEGYFHFYIDESEEFYKLREKPLETILQKDFGDFSLGKKVILNYDNIAKKPSVSIFPKESDLNDLKEIIVTITKELYKRLDADKRCVCKFDDGFGIDLFLINKGAVPIYTPSSEEDSLK